jgi:enamine deaminase RidA (YjgF/YER057c/UK114 family)
MQMPSVDDKLASLGVVLPAPAAAVANYVPYVLSQKLLIISGQVCFGIDGVLAAEHKGKVGGSVSVADGTAAARLCAVQILAQAKAALGSLDRIARCVRLGGFINSHPGFTGLAAVMNGASDLMVTVFGENGRHARTTIGVAELPLGCAVEVDAIFEVR